MKFDYINDVHLDFWVPFDTNQLKFEKKTKEFANQMLPKQPTKILLIGGDLGHYNRQNYWFLEELSKVYTNILLVLGVFCNRKVQRNAIKNAEVCHPFNSFSTMRGTVYSSRHEKR